LSPSGTVYLIDDDESLLRALARAFVQSGVSAKTFVSPMAFLQDTLPEGPGCIVVDLRMPEMSGLDFQRLLRARGTSLPVIFLSGHGDVPAASAAFKAGAVDFLMKPVHSKDLMLAVTEAFKKHEATLVEESSARSVRVRYELLTPREREVCTLIAEGMLNKQVGYSLGAAVPTIKKHRAKVLEKLEVQSVAELVKALELLKKHPSQKF
jgi:FixJ family two-component response regulator